MFDYDRLSLDVAQQFSSPIQKKKDEATKNSCAKPPQPPNSSIADPTVDNDEENSIAHSLQDLLKWRHCSASPIHQTTTYNSIDGFELEDESASRRTSVGSSYRSDACGASSGYGSPGIIETPLTSPSYLAMRKMLADQGYFDATNSLTNVASLVLESRPHFKTSLQQKSLQRQIFENDDDLFLAEMEPRRNSFTVSTKRNVDKENWRKFSISTDTEMVEKNGPFQDMMMNYSVANEGQKNLLSELQLVRSPISTRPSPATVTVGLKSVGPGTNKNTNKNKTSISSDAESSISTPPAHKEDIVAAKDGFSRNEIAQFAQLLSSPRKIPPPRYVCHICYHNGHYITDCPMRFDTPFEELTPYQGRKKCYGEFQCEQCKRKWTSQNSVANEAQSCIKCQVPVYPHKQLPVDKAIAMGLIKTQVKSISCVDSSTGLSTPASVGTPIVGSPNILTPMLV